MATILLIYEYKSLYPNDANVEIAPYVLAPNHKVVRVVKDSWL